MTSIDWPRVRPILERALSLPPAERDGFLDSACGDDAELRRQVGRLLEEEDRDEAFLESPLPEGILAAQSEADRWRAEDGARLGPYRLVRRVGAGGMGDVWLADRADSDFRQQVAIKLIKRGMDTDALLRRFRHERQMLAQLAHRGIPRLIDGGATPDGRPFLVMDYVIGRPIDKFADAATLDVPQRVELFLDVCDAVQHAHEHGIVHRDLKPSNILVTAGGEPKLLDFGIAKVIEAGDAFDTIDLTLTGEQLLTPGYASPEQVRGQPVTAATDVYALGLVLYELLVGRPVVDGESLTRADVEEVVCEALPPRPSAAVDARETSLKRRLVGDLDTICLMALRKEPGRRYASVRQLAEDLRRHLDGLPVLAQPDTITYRLSKFVKRNRALVGGVVVGFLLLFVGLVASLIQKAEAVRAGQVARQTAYAAGLESAEAAIRENRLDVARGRLEEAPLELRGWEWRHFESRLERSELSIPGGARALEWAVSASGEDLIVHDASRELVVLSGATERHRFDAAWPRAFSRSPDGRRVAYGDWYGGVFVLDPEAGEESLRCVISPVEPASIEKPLSIDVAWSPDGRRIALLHFDGSVRVCDAVEGGELMRFPAHEAGFDYGAVCWGPDSRLIASGAWDETVQLFDTVRGEHVGGWRGHTMAVNDVEFSPDGALLLTASMDRSIKIWDVATRSLRAFLRPHTASVNAARFLPDGEQVVSVDAEGAVRITRWESEEVVTDLRGHRRLVLDLALSPDGSRLGTSSVDSVRVWDLASRDVRSIETCELTHFADSALGGEVVVTGSPDGLVRVWSMETLELLHELDPGGGGVNGLDVAPGGERVASAHEDGVVALWDLRSGGLVRRIECGEYRPMSVTVGHSSLVSVGLPGKGRLAELRRWSLETGDLCEVTPIGPMAFDGSPDAVLGEQGRVEYARVVDVGVIGFGADGLLTVLDPVSGADRMVALDRSADAVWLVHAREHEVVVRQSGDGAVVSRWSVGGGVRAVATRPGRDRIAVAVGEQIEIWDPRIPMRVATLNGHEGVVDDVNWTPDGETLISAGIEGRVMLWETR